MRTNQSSDIDKHGQYRKSNRTPSINRQIFCICIIWCHVEHLFDYAPDKIEWNKCNKCTYRSKNPGCKVSNQETPSDVGDSEEFEDFDDADEDIEDDDTAIDDDTYLFPNSDTEYLTKSDLSGMSKSEINLAKNELYARHGRKFKSKELQEYFENKDWYVPKYSPKQWDKKGDSFFFNKYEIKNRDLLKKYENK